MNGSAVKDNTVGWMLAEAKWLPYEHTAVEIMSQMEEKTEIWFKMLNKQGADKKNKGQKKQNEKKIWEFIWINR